MNTGRPLLMQCIYRLLHKVVLFAVSVIIEIIPWASIRKFCPLLLFVETGLFPDVLVSSLQMLVEE
jgi:hypothetical protein